MNELLIINLAVLIACLLCIGWYIEQRLREFECRMENQPWIKLSQLDIDVSIDGPECTYRIRGELQAQNYTAKFVERWLDERGLVMAPKGQDFKVKARAES